MVAGCLASLASSVELKLFPSVQLRGLMRRGAPRRTTTTTTIHGVSVCMKISCMDYITGIITLPVLSAQNTIK